tara:strand:- start:666 stop:887 length:222 start_codon:yes stop_codon:yes gene_type:complete
MLKTPSWYDESPCKGRDRLFFSSELRDRMVAKRICQYECPNRTECLDMALRENMTIGVWGGKTGPELVRLQNA